MSTKPNRTGVRSTPARTRSVHTHWSANGAPAPRIPRATPSAAIFGIGVDLCHIPRMERALPRIASRSFTPAELRRARATARAAEFLAGRWAAKEALLKALGTGISGFIPMKTISIVSAANGEPVIRLPRAAAARLRKIGAGRMHLSISHAGEYAMAAVIIERTEC